mgnify:FL=1
MTALAYKIMLELLLYHSKKQLALVARKAAYFE